MHTTADLMRLARNNPIVGHTLKAWESGHIPTFEQALVHLAVELANHADRLSEDVCQLRKRTI